MKKRRILALGLSAALTVGLLAGCGTKVTITAESVKDHAAPTVEHDPERTHRPRLGGASLRAEHGGKAPKGNVS